MFALSWKSVSLFFVISRSQLFSLLLFFSPLLLTIISCPYAFSSFALLGFIQVFVRRPLFSVIFVWLSHVHAGFGSYYLSQNMPFSPFFRPLVLPGFSAELLLRCSVYYVQMSMLNTLPLSIIIYFGAITLIPMSHADILSAFMLLLSFMFAKKRNPIRRHPWARRWSATLLTRFAVHIKTRFIQYIRKTRCRAIRCLNLAHMMSEQRYAPHMTMLPMSMLEKTRVRDDMRPICCQRATRVYVDMR